MFDYRKVSQIKVVTATDQSSLSVRCHLWPNSWAGLKFILSGVITYGTWNSRNWIFPLKPHLKGMFHCYAYRRIPIVQWNLPAPCFRNCQALIDHKPMKIQGFVPRVWLFPKVGDTAIAKREKWWETLKFSSDTTLETYPISALHMYINTFTCTRSYIPYRCKDR